MECMTKLQTLTRSRSRTGLGETLSTYVHHSEMSWEPFPVPQCSTMTLKTPVATHTSTHLAHLSIMMGRVHTCGTKKQTRMPTWLSTSSPISTSLSIQRCPSEHSISPKSSRTLAIQASADLEPFSFTSSLHKV